MTKHILFTAALGGLVSFSAEAQDRGPREADPRQNMREALIKKFDKNGDGKLDQDERPSREQLQEFFRSQLGDRPSGRPDEGRPGESRPGGRPGEGRRREHDLAGCQVELGQLCRLLEGLLQ